MSLTSPTTARAIAAEMRLRAKIVGHTRRDGSQHHNRKPRFAADKRWPARHPPHPDRYHWRTGFKERGFGVVLNRRGFAAASVGAGFLMVMVFSACSGSSPDSGAPSSVGWVDGGSWYVREPWPHDGNPYESRRFVVFSDSASVEARIELAETVEGVWDEVLAEMSIDPDLLAMPPGQEKFDIYAFEDRSPDWAGKAYYGGLIVSSPNRRVLLGLVQVDQRRLEATIKHELVHVASESLLHGGGLTEPPWVPVWFFEGLAEVVSRGTGAGAITGRDHFDSLTSEYGHLNPVSYQSDEGIEGGPNAYTEYHYPMRRLAVEYLFDEKGYDVSLSEATGLLADMAAGRQFDSAFADRMGVIVAEYESRFFELMDDYLPDRSVPSVLTPVGLLVLSATLTAAAIGVTSWSIRNSASATAVGQGTEEDTTRKGRVGLVTWIAATSIFALVIFLIGVFTIGLSWGLSGPGQVSGMAVMIAYFAAVTLAVNWAIRNRRKKPQGAMLMPLTAIFGAVVATVGITLITEML